MSARKIVKFKKRNVAGQCRAMRCKETTELQEHDRPGEPTVLLCVEHHARAVAHSPAADTPADVPADAAVSAVRIAVDGASGQPIYSLDGGASWVFGEPPDEPAYDETAHDDEAAALAEREAQAAAQALEGPPPSEATTVVVEHADVTALVGPLASEWQGMAPQLVGFVVNDQATVDTVGALLLQVKSKLAELEKGRKLIVRPLLDAKNAVDDLFRPATEAATHIEGLLKGALGEFTDRQAAAQVAALAAGQHDTALATVQPIMPKGVSTVTVWRWRVIDPRLIPADYLVVDAARVQGVVNAMKGACNIPGIEAYPETGVRAATK